MSESLNDRLTTDGATTNNRFSNTNSNATTNLESSIDAGSLGRRFGGGQVATGAAANQTFKLPISVLGTNTPTDTRVLSANKATLTSGTAFDKNATGNIAMVGKDLATKK